MLDLEALRDRLATTAALPKDAMLDDARTRLDRSQYPDRDRRTERTMLQALTDGKASPDHHRKALRLANCRSDQRCGHWACPTCKQRWWARNCKLASKSATGLSAEEISFLTVILGPAQNSDQAMAMIREFKDRWRRRAKTLFPSIKWIGRFEIDYYLPGELAGMVTRANGKFTGRLKTLHQLGWREDDQATLVPHLHLLLFHKGLTRGQAEYRVYKLRPRPAASKQFQIKRLKSKDDLDTNIQNLIRYPLKHRAPESAMPRANSKFLRPRRGRCSELRYYVDLIDAAGGLKGLLHFRGPKTSRQRFSRPTPDQVTGNLRPGRIHRIVI